MKKPVAFLSSDAGRKFAKLVGMLGSAHAGEAGNAATMATKLLQEAGLTWGEVLGAGTSNGFQRFSDGGQTVSIRDLEKRLEILQGQLKMAHTLQAMTYSELSKAKGLIASLQTKLTVAEGEVLAARRAFEQAGPEVKMRTPDKDNDGTRKFASKMQAILNWTIDQIEDAIELNDWEQGFLKSMRDLKWKISPKQFAKLEDMAERAGVDLSKLAAEIG